MNTLEMKFIGAMPGKDGKVFLNGEEVTTDVFKVEINVTNILLYRYENPRTFAEQEGERKLVETVTVIDSLKVNG